MGITWAAPAQFVRLLAGADATTLLTLVDLHRIALTYVTNKKGGDQVIDTEKVQFEKLHQAEGYADQSLSSELISGAVSAATSRTSSDGPRPALASTSRSRS